MDECKHNHLSRLEGALHPNGKDYVCRECGEQFTAEKSVIGAHLGKMPGEVKYEKKG